MNAIYSLQYRIAARAVQLLKPGGRLVYSTCSLNPIENEAVVSALLNTFEGLFDFGSARRIQLIVTLDMFLVDASDQLVELKRKPGMQTWKVIGPGGIEIPAPSGTGDSEETTWGNKPKPLARTLWPNGKEVENKLERW